MVRSGERVLTSLHAILCEKVARRLQGWYVSVFASGKNVSRGKAAIKLKKPLFTPLLTLLDGPVFYVETNARVKHIRECVSFVPSISRHVQQRSFIQRVLGS